MPLAPGNAGDAPRAGSVRAPCRAIAGIKLSLPVVVARLGTAARRGNSYVSHAPSTSYSQRLK